jgi:hypothetical protein
LEEQKNMDIRKQDLNGIETAMLYQALTENLFTKPNIGDIWLIGHEQDTGFTFYFKLEYYDQLKNEMQLAHSHGKFAQSNANTDWMNLMNRLFTAVFESSELEYNIDNQIESKELEHIQVLKEFKTTQRTTEKKVELAEQINVKVKDEQNRPLEEDEYNTKGELNKIKYYKYLDSLSIVEVRIIELSGGSINYSLIHRYKNDKILEEWIFMGGGLTSIDVWIYDEGGRFMKKIIYPTYA